MGVLTGSNSYGRSTLCTNPDCTWPAAKGPDLNFSGKTFLLRLHPLCINGAGLQLLSAITHGCLGKGLMSEGRICEFFLQGVLKGSQVIGPLELQLRWSSDAVLQYLSLPFRPREDSSEQLLQQWSHLQQRRLGIRRSSMML